MARLRSQQARRLTLPHTSRALRAWTCDRRYRLEQDRLPHSAFLVRIHREDGATSEASNTGKIRAGACMRDETKHGRQYAQAGVAIRYRLHGGTKTVDDRLHQAPQSNWQLIGKVAAVATKDVAYLNLPQCLCKDSVWYSAGSWAGEPI